jgi:hypothetical protein
VGSHAKANATRERRKIRDLATKPRKTRPGSFVEPGLAVGSGFYFSFSLGSGVFSFGIALMGSGTKIGAAPGTVVTPVP